jgi:hypothetical protein
MRSMRTNQKPYSQLEAIVNKYRSRLKKESESWSATANTLFDYGQNSETVKWTRDWRSYPDLTVKDLIPVVAARWELYQFRAARLAIEHALSLPEENVTSLLRVWAGLDALLQRKHDVALDHARNIAVQHLHGWYQLGYRMLVTAIESLPNIIGHEGRLDNATVKQLVAQLRPKDFLVDTPFANDQLSKWLCRQLSASIAEAHGHRLTAWSQRLIAFTYTVR